MSSSSICSMEIACVEEYKWTYKFGGRNSHIKALECHLQAILSTGYQPQCYKELLRGTEVQHVM